MAPRREPDLDESLPLHVEQEAVEAASRLRGDVVACIKGAHLCRRACRIITQPLTRCATGRPRTPLDETGTIGGTRITPCERHLRQQRSCGEAAGVRWPRPERFGCQCTRCAL